LDLPWLGKCGVLFLLDLYIYFGFPLARLKWSYLLKLVRLPLQSVHFLTFPLLSSSLLHFPLLSHTHSCSYVHSPTLCTITRYQTLEVDDSRTYYYHQHSTPPSALTSGASDRLRTGFGCIGTGPCDTTVPSAITWTPIYERFGTRRLGTAFLCISL
jgi:hypothetical protein